VVSRSPQVDSAQRAENREVQTALNYFGFNAGSPDGVFGRNTRTAVSAYQAHLGYPVTGELTQVEKQFLLGSYGRAQAGGALTLQQIAATPGGAAGLLVAWRDELAGGAGGTNLAAAPAIVPANPPLLAAEPSAPRAVQPAAPGGLATFAALPTFMADGTAQASLTSHCNKVSLLTNTNGGFTTLATMTDGDGTLSEQFCLARTYAIATGEELAAKVQGFTPAQIEAQCASFGTSLAPQLAALAQTPAAEVIADTSAFVAASGMAAGQLAGTARICLSVGYRTDDLPTALGSALILTALGELPYAELIGHHLMFGFGTAPRQDLAVAWYGLGIEALKAGAVPVFAPGQPERAALLAAAVFGPAEAGPVVPASAAPAASDSVRNKLPGFAINN
jgi:peptidoglycan hydrolase-like protein with peptidoglycan-binding domain